MDMDHSSYWSPAHLGDVQGNRLWHLSASAFEKRRWGSAQRPAPSSLTEASAGCIWTQKGAVCMFLQGTEWVLFSVRMQQQVCLVLSSCGDFVKDGNTLHPSCCSLCNAGHALVIMKGKGGF